MDQAALDESRQLLARDVDDVRLAVVEHVDGEDAAAGLGERGRERHADIAGADHGDVVGGALSHARQG